MTPLLAYRLRRDLDGSFESVYRRHVRDVYGFALNMLGNAEDAEDVAQTTFLNAYRALQRGERVQNLRAWLLAIAHNVCRQRFRTAARRPREVELDAEAAEAFRDDDAPSAQEIRTAMGQLSFNQRTVLVLREIEGLAYEEIAEAMGISLSAVETLLFRARQALREQLEAAENDLGCDAVQRLISLQLDGKLSRHDRGLLRAHLRTCSECASFARSQRARKRVMPGLIAVPLPAGLMGTFKPLGAALVTSKAAALAVSAALVGTGTLVQTGLVPAPGKSSRERPAAAKSTSTRAAGTSSEARATLEVERAERGATPRATKRGAKARPAGARARNGNDKAQAGVGGAAASAAGATGASQAEAAGGSADGDGGGGAGDGGQASAVPNVGGLVQGGGGGGQGAVGGATSTVGGAVGGAVGDAQSAVGGIRDNLPTPPSVKPPPPPVQPQSLPPVTLPGLPPVQLPSTPPLP